MDGDGGVPLAFSINKGNTNEQLTLKPLEEKKFYLTLIYLNLLSVQMQDFLPVVIGNLITKKRTCIYNNTVRKKIKSPS